MEKRKIYINLILTFVGFFAIVIGAISQNANTFIARSGFEPNSIAFNATKNKLASGATNPSGYTGSGNATTELENMVAFDYSGLTNPSDKWQTIKAGGYITNTQPITGMESITLTKANSSAHFKVYWSNATTFVEERSVLFDTSSALTVTTNFDGYMPNYIKITAVADSEITSGAIDFSCVDNWSTLSLNVVSSYMGSVTGAGVYTIGQNVTIGATANTGYNFVGWYDGATLLSNNASYKFAMPSNDATYNAKFVNVQPLVDEGTYTFGMYPQSKVTDNTLITTLNTAAGTLPSASNNQLWTDYGYYISGAVSSYMWYIDLANGYDEYRGVYFTSYRPYYIGYGSSAANSYQDNNGYTLSSVYWFKYEPITWHVLDIQNDNAFLIADLVLDSQNYYYSQAQRTIGGNTVYASNYEHSHIRSWLNDSFYNTAFTSEEKARIQTTNVANNIASTGYPTNAYAGNNTNDKIFLLSYVEATNASYELNTKENRQFQPSAYAKSQGVYTYPANYNSSWWLRSPVQNPDYSVRFVDYSGGFTSTYITTASGGVIPALWISV